MYYVVKSIYNTIVVSARKTQVNYIFGIWVLLFQKAIKFMQNIYKCYASQVEVMLGCWTGMEEAMHSIIWLKIGIRFFRIDYRLI